MQLVGLIGLIVGLHQKFHGEGIVLIFFEAGNSFVELLLIHQQSSSRSVVRALNHAVATAGRHSFELLQRLVGQCRIPGMRGAHGTVAQNARQFLILIGLGNRAAMSQRLFRALQIFQRGIVVCLILGQVPVGLRFLQVLFFGVRCLRNLLE